jgi:ATP-dependent RNA helicase RhlE
MLDLGFLKPIRQIAARLPRDRQSLFFSATMPREIAVLADELLRSPVKIAVTPAATTVERIRQRVIHVDSQKKRALLAELLADVDMTRTLVFTRTKRGADRVAKHLEGAGVRSAAIHGNKSQSQREAALDALRRGRIRVLVATDIAARGIDIDEISHVVNYELPEVPEAYVHRIGRTARAGADGIAISLCDTEERDLLRAIERLTRQSIAAEDRRGDARLTADASGGTGRELGHRDGRQPAARSRGDRSHAGQTSAKPHRKGRSPQRDESVPAHRGQSRRGAQRAVARADDARRSGSDQRPPRREKPSRRDDQRSAGGASAHGRSLADVAFFSHGRPRG